MLPDRKIAVVWMTIYGGGFILSQLPGAMPSPERAMQSLPNVLKGWYDWEILSRLMLTSLGYLVTREIDREIAQYELGGATMRFERYPRMDVLVDVVGIPEAIERAIVALGMPREAFTTERLPEFVARFEARTGQEAALADCELAGLHPYRLEDA